MLSTQSVSVTSPAVLVLLTRKIFPFGEVFNWICHPSSGRQEWNIEFSLFCGQVSWTQEGMAIRGCSWPCRESWQGWRLCPGDLGCSHEEGEHCSVGLQYRRVYAGHKLWGEVCTKLSEIPAIKLCSRISTRSQPSQLHLHQHTALYLPASRAILSDL